MSKWYDLKHYNAATSNRAEIFIYNDIGYFGISAEQFVSELEGLGRLDQIDVRINSYGGAVIDAIAIHNALRRNSAKVSIHIDGIAASSASVIALGGDEIHIADNAFFMIHNPLVLTYGNAEDLKREIAVLEKIGGTIVDLYVKRNGDANQVKKWMDAETWFTAQEAKDAKFIDVIDSGSKETTSDPQNSFRQYLNKTTSGPRVRPTERAKELGLSELLNASPTPAPPEKEAPMTKEQFNAFAAEHPEAVKELEVVNKLAADEFNRGKTEGEKAATPVNATAKELKAAFPNDPDFVMNRLDTEAPMADHKAAFCDHLQNKVKAAEAKATEAQNRLAEIDPAHAGTHPVNTGAKQEGEQKPSEARVNELAAMAGF